LLSQETLAVRKTGDISCCPAAQALGGCGKALVSLGKKIYKSGFSTSILVYPKVTNGETELTRKPQENCH
jgi:hypothetical protein